MNPDCASGIMTALDLTQPPSPVCQSELKVQFLFQFCLVKMIVCYEPTVDLLLSMLGVLHYLSFMQLLAAQLFTSTVLDMKKQ